MWPATVATIIKVLSPVQIEYAARRWRLMPKDQAQDHHLGDDLDQSGNLHTRPAGERDAWRATSSSCLALLWSNSSSRSTPTTEPSG